MLQHSLESPGSNLWRFSRALHWLYISVTPFCFCIDDRLYIVMELIEGAPLGEHFNSLKEKHHHFSEERLWKIFIQVHYTLHWNFLYTTKFWATLECTVGYIYGRNQICFHSCFKLCLALRYLHKEKRIVHRDLTPNNIMLGDKDKVTVSKYKSLQLFNWRSSECQLRNAPHFRVVVLVSRTFGIDGNVFSELSSGVSKH